MLEEILLRVFFKTLKKAFATVPHRRLLEKLSQVHLYTYVVESYLTERSQCVVINGASSQPVHVLSGVPQGSVLGHCSLYSTSIP